MNAATTSPHLLDPDTVAAIRADDARLTARHREILEQCGYESIESVSWSTRRRSGEIVLLDAGEALLCAEVLRKASFTGVKVDCFDWTDDDDFAHDFEWVITFKVD